MPEHVLRGGREVIDSLAALGEAFGYSVVRERPLPRTTAAVDLAWLREPTDPAPLFVFEIESRPGEGLASNAMKVLGRDAAGVAKPLHLFHVVVRGGLRSRRPVDTSREFAGHNYTIHLLESRTEPKELLGAVLDAHRRVMAAVDAVAFGAALAAPLWSEMPPDTAMEMLEVRGFHGVSGGAVATLARQNGEFRRTLVRQLLNIWGDVLRGERPPPNRYYGAKGHPYASYGSYMADAACEGLELGLIACLSPQHGEVAYRALERWQEANHIGDSLGPFTGAGTQWTQYAVGHLGYYWALIAALFTGVPDARAWCASQPLHLLKAVGRQAAVERALLALWVMHALPDDPEYERIHEEAAQALRAVGGISLAWIARPRPSGPEQEAPDDEDLTTIAPGHATAFVPGRRQLRVLVRTHGTEPGDPVDLALDALLDDPAMRPADGAALVAYLARH